MRINDCYLSTNLFSLQLKKSDGDGDLWQNDILEPCWKSNQKLDVSRVLTFILSMIGVKQ